MQIAGVDIAAGQTVLLSLAAANRDPERFDRPDVPVVDRTVNPHLSFGAGVHRCLGVPLVRMQTGIVLSRMIHRFPAIALAVEPEKLDWREGFRHRGVRRLPVSL
jgi:cytochrome P450